MDPALKARLTSRDLWMRLLYMVLFAIAYRLAELVMVAVAIIQFVFILIAGSANELLLHLGQNLTRYIADIIRFQTFNTEEKPFPFADWPDEAAGGERWREQEETAVEMPRDASAGEAAEGAPSAEDAPSVEGAAPETDTDESERGGDPASTDTPRR